MKTFRQIVAFPLQAAGLAALAVGILGMLCSIVVLHIADLIGDVK